MNDAESLKNLLHEVLPWYRGIGVSSPRFSAFLMGRKACANTQHIFSACSLTGQIELNNGILFSEREVLARNKFTEGRYLVLGSSLDYSPIVLNVKNGTIGMMPYCDVTDDELDEEFLVPVAGSFVDFLHDNVRRKNLSRKEYLVPRSFNTDVHWVIDALGVCEMVATSRIFHDFLEKTGVDESFVYNDLMPEKDIWAGICNLFNYQDLMKFNPENRRRANPDFLVIGGCPDGGFVVLHLTDNASTPEVGYVAFAEVGDEGPWLPHYVKVSSSLGCFLHDSNFLGLLPDDYYQAVELGYKRPGATC